jgi:hypothetical protein
LSFLCHNPDTTICYNETIKNKRNGANDMIKALLTVSISVFLLAAPLTFGIPGDEKDECENVMESIMADEASQAQDYGDVVIAIPDDEVHTEGVIRMLGVRNETPTTTTRLEDGPGCLDPDGVIRMLGVKNDTTAKDTR